MVEDPLEPYKRADSEFRKSADAIAKRFRSKMQRASRKMRAAVDRTKGEMDLAKAEFEAEMSVARKRFKAELARLQTLQPIAKKKNVEDVTEGVDYDWFREANAEFNVELSRSSKARQQERRNKQYQRKRRRKPPKRRGLEDGGLPAPVKPRPNPTPLVDGAEAPIE